jgi:hypothetical protein
VITPAWQKSRYSSYNGGCVQVGSRQTSKYSTPASCVQVGAEVKSSYSAMNGNCATVEQDTRDGEVMIVVRDTKEEKAGVPDGERTELAYNLDEWACFIAGAKDGQFDLSPDMWSKVSPEVQQRITASVIVA